MRLPSLGRDVGFADNLAPLYHFTVHECRGCESTNRRNWEVSPGAAPPTMVFSPTVQGRHGVLPFSKRAQPLEHGDDVKFRCLFITLEIGMLKGKTALITGSTSGIGRGIAEALAKAGANIVLNGFGPADEIEALRARLAGTYAVAAHYDGADMSQPAAIETMIGTAIVEFGAVDILVNNAGIQHVAPIEDFPPEKWHAIIAINLVASFHTIRHVLPGMKQRRWGRIINIASAHALVASPFKSAYVAAKHGVAGLTKTVALEVAEYGITVNAICPGYVLTPLVEKQIPDTARARSITPEQVVKEVLLAAQPTKRFITVAEVASLATYLASDEAASITGSIIALDGGWTAQ
jgi:3-hydroxybutyrate dehydrogenase